jgi:eukaryotic-like serine/threonine-protein kinase
MSPEFHHHGKTKTAGRVHPLFSVERPRTRDYGAAFAAVEHDAACDVKGRTVTASRGAESGSDKAWPATCHRDDCLSSRDPNRYEICGVHGQGGLGRVLIAYDRDLGRPVAVKELLRSSPRNETRFVREARITARLEHPAIVPVHDAGCWPNGESFYTMKLVAGRPLKELYSERRTLKERLTLLPNVLAVADAIAYAHSKKIIHRDIKPSNVIVGEFGETVVIDWGLAKDLSTPEEAVEDDPRRCRVGSGGEITVLGEILGTPAYMSPEQARGESVDEKTDIYALGTLVYELLAGRRPYSNAETTEPTDVLAAVRDLLPQDVRKAAGEHVPEELVAIVRHAMARDPRQRYDSAAELAADLRRFQNGQLVGVHHYTRAHLLRRWGQRHRAGVIAGIAAVFVIVGVASAAFVR